MMVVVYGLPLFVYLHFSVFGLPFIFLILYI